MSRRHQLPARLPAGTIDRFDLDAIVDRTTDGTWAEKALEQEAAHVRDIAVSVADAAVYTMAKVFEAHRLVDGTFERHDNDALYHLTAEIAARLIHERLIDRLGDGRGDPGAGRELAVSVVLRGSRR
jgi:hypothetical protein